MREMAFLEKLLDGVEVEWKALKASHYTQVPRPLNCNLSG